MITYFRHYNQIDVHEGVDGDKIRAAAEDPKKNADVIAALSSELDGDDKQVADAVEGDIKTGTRANTQEGAKVPRNLQRAGYYAVGLLNLYAAYVDKFDDAVTKLNDRLRAQAGPRPPMMASPNTTEITPVDAWESGWADAKAALAGEYKTALGQVDDDSETIATKFDQGPTAENVRALFRAGLIPLGKQSLWPDMALTDDDKRKAYANAVKNGTLPDFSTMTDDQVETYIEDHPEISEDLVVLMGAPYLNPALTSLVNAQSRIDAKTLNAAIDDEDRNFVTLDQIQAATARLDAINENIADGGKMTAAQGEYIETWLNTVGADNLAKLPAVVESAIPSGMPSYAYESTINGYLSPVSDAILNYSNPAVHRDDAGIDLAGYNGGSTFTPADGRITLAEMPQAIQDLANLRLGEPHDGYRYGSGDDFDSIKNLDKVTGWATLMSSASENIEGGDQFSQELGHQAIHLKQDMNSILASANGLNREDIQDWNPEARQLAPELRDLEALKTLLDDGPASQLLSVASRNEDASSAMLVNDSDRNALLGLNWNNDQGVIDVIGAGTDRDPEHGGGGPQQAAATLALIEDVSKNETSYLGGRFDSDGDGDIDKNDAVAPGRMTEGISDAVVDAGINWVDQFGDAHGSDQKNESGEHGFDMNPSTESMFLRFVSATGDEDAIRFHGAAAWNAQQQISQAMESGKDGEVQVAIDRAGRLEGRIIGADMEHQIDQGATQDADGNQQADEKYSAKQRQMAAFRMVADVGLSVIPGAKAVDGAGALTQAGVSMFNSASGKVQSGFLDQLFDAGGPPVDSHAHETKITNEWQSQSANDAQGFQRCLIVQAALKAGTLSPDEVDSSLYTVENGHYVLKPEVDAEQLSTPYFSLNLDEGTYESGWDAGFNGRDQDRRTGDGGWLDNETAANNLYGEDAGKWEDDKGVVYNSPTRSMQSDANPYNSDPEQNDDWDEVADKYKTRR